MAWINKYRLLIAIIAVSFTASIAYSFSYRIDPVVDAKAYDAIAMNIVNGHGFREDLAKPLLSDMSIVRAGPGYEYFLALLYSLFGYRYEAVWIVQALVHAGTVFFIFLIARQLFDDPDSHIGYCAALMFGLHPDLIEISAMLLTETLYLFFIGLFLYVFIYAYKKNCPPKFGALLGVVSGFGILMRPPMVLFVFAVVVLCALEKRTRFGILFTGSLVLVLLPWMLRNYFMYHQFIVTTLIGQYNMWVGNTLVSNGGQFSEGTNPVAAYVNENGFGAFKQVANATFFNFILAHPFIFLKLTAIRAIRFFSLIRPMGFWFYQTGIKQTVFVVSSAVAISISFVSGFSGMALALKQRRPLIYYCIFFAATAPLVLLPTVVQSRYRFQLYPFLALFGSYGLLQLYKGQVGSKKIFVYSAIILGVISIVDVFSFWRTAVEHLALIFT